LLIILDVFFSRACSCLLRTQYFSDTNAGRHDPLYDRYISDQTVFTAFNTNVSLIWIALHVSLKFWAWFTDNFVAHEVEE